MLLAMGGGCKSSAKIFAKFCAKKISKESSGSCLESKEMQGGYNNLENL